MNRIIQRLKVLGESKLLIPFFTVGYPDFQSSLDLVKVACDSGADFVELGMPFSDPLADGPDIQLSSTVSLRNGTNLKKILTGVEIIRKESEIPLILMGYYNPILTYGETRFLTDAARRGVDGFIIPDLPVDEASAIRKAADASNLSVTFLVSPTSSDKRLKLIDDSSTDFVYAITVTGVTGTGKAFGGATERYLKKLRIVLNKRFVAGFGVSSPETARHLVRYSDGVVIGSALVRLITRTRTRREYFKQVGQFLTSIRKALQ